MNPIRVLLASSEAAPFVKVGGLADVVGALPRTLVRQNVDARVILPLYHKIKQEYMPRLESLGWKMIKMGWRSLYAGLYRIVLDDVIFYFIDNEYYFSYEQVYVEYTFDIERYCFYQRAVLEFMGESMQFEPDVLHCNDWQTGMMPMLLDAHYRSRGLHMNVKTVYTIHNLKYQGIHSTEMVRDLLDLPDVYVKEELMLKEGAANFMKAGTVYANSVTTVSPTYAYEIMTDYFGEGLNGVLRQYAYKVSGVLNGIDEKEYNPSADKYLPMTFSYPDYEEGKAACKKSVQHQLNLEENPGAPLCVMISRLVDQKGLDLLLRVLEEMLFDGMQVVILGTGDAFYEKALTEVASRNACKMCACISFDNGLAHTLYAGADIYLMPSIFEPCGLSQMIAMRYGTIPVVRETGGLKDTVIPYNEYTGEGNGFSFANINAHEFLFVTKYACDVYRHQKNVWKHLQMKAMTGDYSWDRSAREYAGLYALITGLPLPLADAEKSTLSLFEEESKLQIEMADSSVERTDSPNSAQEEVKPRKTVSRTAKPDLKASDKMLKEPRTKGLRENSASGDALTSDRRSSSEEKSSSPKTGTGKSKSKTVEAKPESLAESSGKKRKETPKK